ncbi:helix-turn-helix domain-containing protein [Nostoc sp.]|uniref:helix-turn-helix domain-containing protein n=1 Tax=Nostoc sp. TaxID=1180 RepID=UPI002FF70954
MSGQHHRSCCLRTCAFINRFLKPPDLSSCYDIMTVDHKRQHLPPKSVLKALRENAGLSQEQLAVYLGIAVSTLRRWENEGMEPSMTKKQWQTFCQLVGVSFDALPQSLAVPAEANA